MPQNSNFNTTAAKNDNIAPESCAIIGDTTDTKASLTQNENSAKMGTEMDELLVWFENYTFKSS